VLIETPVSGEASPSIEAADDDLLRGRADLGSSIWRARWKDESRQAVIARREAPRQSSPGT
jgi:hypothetical protein